MRYLQPFILFSTLIITHYAYSANDDGASDLGVDYAFLTLMTLSPDFAAANYNIDNTDGTNVDIAIVRLPYHIKLMKKKFSQLELELALAHHRTEEIINTFPADDEYIDADWNTTGLSMGLLYESDVTANLTFISSVRIGTAQMNSDATYNGPLTNLIKNSYDGTLLNWKTNSALLNLG